MKQIFIIVVLVFSVTVFATAQIDTLYVEKKECSNNFRGNKLVLHYKSDTTQQTSFTYGYDLDYFVGLDDRKKLMLIEALLTYENDTSHCCMKIIGYSLNGNEGCKGVPKNVNRFTIQIDALFMINRLVWPKLMELYSCSPVLYDNNLKKEINSDPEKIKCVFGEYKKWYEECKSKGSIARYFPFNDGRYVWYGGRKSITPKQ